MGRREAKHIGLAGVGCAGAKTITCILMSLFLVFIPNGRNIEFDAQARYFFNGSTLLVSEIKIKFKKLLTKTIHENIYIEHHKLVVRSFHILFYTSGIITKLHTYFPPFSRSTIK